MSAHAFVIGINGYPHEEWRLTGAVRDAVEFARWAVTAGKVDPANLTLLLSAAPDDPPLSDLLKAHDGAPDLSAIVQPATLDNIRKTQLAYQLKRRGETAGRLWFFYAGHGIAARGEGPAAGPLVVPADVDDLDVYVNSGPIGLEIFRQAMQDQPPREQFYFVDACRDVLPRVGTKELIQSLYWDLSGSDANTFASQAILFATTAGNRAKELHGYGLFSRALLAGLRALGPKLTPPDGPPARGQPPRMRLAFGDLAKFTRRAVQKALEDLTDDPKVEPEKLLPVPFGGTDLTVAEFARSDLPTVEITAIVDPKKARASGAIHFLQWSDDKYDFVPLISNPAPVGPPLEETEKFRVRGGDHVIRISAKGFAELTKTIFVYEDKRLPFELEAVGPGGPESLEGFLGAGRKKAGTLSVVSRDRLARVSVFDGGGRRLGHEYGFVFIENLRPGSYRVVGELTAMRRVEQIVRVRAGEIKSITLEIPGSAVSAVLAAALAERDIPVSGNYADVSENLGEVATARVGSILAYAAWAARWPPEEGFARLRAIGVDALQSLMPRDCAVQVLVGDMADPNAAGAARVHVEPARAGGAPLAPARVLFVGGEQAPMPLTVRPLPGLSFGAQASAVLPPGPIRVRIEMPGFAPVSFALSLIPGFVTVLVIARDQNGDVDVQEYMNTVNPMIPVGEGFEPPMKDDVRLVELAWRALRGKDPLDSIEHKGLLEGKRSNPFLGVIAGYRMFRTERADEFRVFEEPPAAERKTKSALWNLVRFFPDLPDVHVLAGLYDAARRDEHFQRAIERGTPALVEGFWALVDWLTEKARAAGLAPPVLGHSVLPGIVWTAFSEPTRAEQVEAIHVVPATGRARRATASSDRMLSLAASVGRLGPADDPSSFLCSSFLAAPRIAVCPVHFALKFGSERPDGTWQLDRPMQIRFDLADSSKDRLVGRIVRTLRPPNSSTVDGGFLPAAVLAQCWPVLLELTEPAATPSLPLGNTVPAPGAPVAVIGFPRDDARITSALFAQHFAGGAGEKHYMTGVILRSAGETWTLDYDSFTADGVSGGPVIDPNGGAVIGMHVASQPPRDPRARKCGVALVMTRFAIQGSGT